MSELNHGSNSQMTFEPGFVTEQFPLHQTERPGRHKALRGVQMRDVSGGRWTPPGWIRLSD